MGVEITKNFSLEQNQLARIEGTSVNYCIDAFKWSEIQSSLNGLFDTYIKDRECSNKCV